MTTRFLLATGSVHTAAAACDYLTDRLGDGAAVVVVTVTGADAGDDGTGDSRRDAADAANVARARLAGLADVTVEERTGEPGPAVADAVAAHAPDEVIVGAPSGEPGAERRVGGTTTHLLTALDVPVVVVPPADP